MADNEPRLPLTCASEAFTPPDPEGSQLEFTFAAKAGCPAGARRIPDHSRQELRSGSLGRSLVAPRLERPIEEVLLEHGVSGHLPPGKVLNLRLTENRYTIVSVQRGRECRSEERRVGKECRSR